MYSAVKSSTPTLTHVIPSQGGGSVSAVTSVRSCSGVVSLKNGSLMTAIKTLLYTIYTVMLTDKDDDDDEL